MEGEHDLADVVGELADTRAALQRALSVLEVSYEKRAQLEHALQSRILIEQAKGILSERLRLPMAEAFEVLRGAARSNGLKAHVVAAQVVDEPETPAIVLAALQARLSRT